MKILSIMIFLIGMSGCAHQTIHEYCAGHAEHYGSYEECYQEIAQLRAERRAQPNFMQAFANGYTQTIQQSRQNMTCMPNGFGGMNCR